MLLFTRSPLTSLSPLFCIGSHTCSGIPSFSVAVEPCQVSWSTMNRFLMRRRYLTCFISIVLIQVLRSLMIDSMFPHLSCHVCCHNRWSFFPDCFIADEWKETNQPPLLSMVSTALRTNCGVIARTHLYDALMECSDSLYLMKQLLQWQGDERKWQWDELRSI